jgi:hypothetical protein
VSDDFANRDPLSQAEERLLSHVHALREQPPEPGDELLESVMSAVRWQIVFRPYLAAVGALASAVGAGVTVSLAGPKRR